MSGFAHQENQRELNQLIDSGTSALRKILNHHDHSKETTPTTIKTEADTEEVAVARDELESALNEIKLRLCNDVASTEGSSADTSTIISQNLRKSGLLMKLIECFLLLSFNTRKHTAAIFNNLLHKDIHNFTHYVEHHLQQIKMLLDYYGSHNYAENISTSCGAMLRECARHPNLAKGILESSRFWKFLDVYVYAADFEIASDAFHTMKDFITTPKCPTISSDFLEIHYKLFLQKYDALLHSENYITRRRSLKLLSELLLNRNNYTMMMDYISQRHNLKTIMHLLRHKSNQIQFEAFHVFKIFVANPDKNKEIEHALLKNKEKLISYLHNFHRDKDSDPQFSEEKQAMISTLEELPDPNPHSPRGSFIHAPYASPSPASHSTVGIAEKGSPEADRKDDVIKSSGTIDSNAAQGFSSTGPNNTKALSSNTKSQLCKLHSTSGEASSFLEHQVSVNTVGSTLVGWESTPESSRGSSAVPSRTLSRAPSDYKPDDGHSATRPRAFPAVAFAAALEGSSGKWRGQNKKDRNDAQGNEPVTTASIDGDKEDDTEAVNAIDLHALAMSLIDKDFPEGDQRKD